MKTAVPGYPRIGKRRELKKATESYFRGEIGPEGLEAAARGIRLASWRAQAAAGIDFMPSNDFSLYDQVLDAAILFGILPREFAEAGLSPLDGMFAMARGFQDGDTDLRALPMKKWFNTNYHYIEPRWEGGIVPSLSSDKPLREYLEAKAAGFGTRPAVLGPFTFLKLCRFGDNANPSDAAGPLAEAYLSLLAALSGAGAAWTQFDEPALVTDLDSGDVELFRNLYRRIIAGKASALLHLHVPYGAPLDCFGDIAALGFDGIGLDFVEGPENLGLLKRHPLPGGTTLVAGVIDGKNVWKSDLAETQTLIEGIASSAGKTLRDDTFAIGPSCSLIHVPLSLEGENRLDPEVRRRLAFAEEKLAELGQLADAARRSYRIPPLPAVRTEAGEGSAVRERVLALKESDFTRSPSRTARAPVQQAILGLPPLPTTTIGSFPQTAGLRKLRSDFGKGEISEEAYGRVIEELVAECIALQEKLGLDVLVHGEFERTDMVEFFARNLEGFAVTDSGWVQSYGTRYVKPPIVVSDVRRRKPMTAALAAFAQGLTGKPVKAMLTGPVTILNWSFPRKDLSLGECARQIALAIRDEALDLERAGMRIIQIDEAALREKLPLRRADRAAYFAWAIPSFRLAHAALKPETQVHTHMCYSDFGDIVAEIDAMDADVVSFEASRSRYEILDALAARGFATAVGPGLYDIHSPRVPEGIEFEWAILTMLGKLGKSASAYDGLWINPDCGLKTRDYPETERSLANMVAAAKRIRNADRG